MTNIQALKKRKSRYYEKGHPSYTPIGIDHGRYKHGQGSPGKQSPLYRRWMGMKRRCLNKHDKSYPRYGGAGIKICDKWLDFQGFAEDMAASFKPKLSLERLNSRGNYEPSNCTWIPLEMQSKNRRNVKLYTYKGRVQTLPDWEKELGYKPSTLRARINRQGMTFEQAITVKLHYAHKFNK